MEVAPVEEVKEGGQMTSSSSSVCWHTEAGIFRKLPEATSYSIFNKCHFSLVKAYRKASYSQSVCFKFLDLLNLIA